jgi:hypothetical protein
MAGEIKQNGFFIFDQSWTVQKKDEQAWPIKTCPHFSSRYAVLTLCFLWPFEIFYNTANPSFDRSIVPASETRGVTRQQSVAAARGEIFDSTGIPLAYRKKSIHSH